MDRGSREPVQPGHPLARSSCPPSLRMRSPSPSLPLPPSQPRQPTAPTRPTAPSTWSTHCWQSCKYWPLDAAHVWHRCNSVSLLKCVVPYVSCCKDLTLSVLFLYVTRSTLVIKQKLPGIYVQPSYKSALSKNPLFPAYDTE